MSETITLTNTAFSKALMSQYGEFMINHVQNGKKASVFAFVGSVPVGGISNATIELERLPTGETRILFVSVNSRGSVIEFIAEDVKFITHVKFAGCTEWEVKTKQGISFEIIPR